MTLTRKISLLEAKPGTGDGTNGDNPTDEQVIRMTSQWALEYLARGHPLLGRSGPVCPFVPKALSLGFLDFKVVRTAHLTFDEQNLEKQIDITILEARDNFCEQVKKIHPTGW